VRVIRFAFNEKKAAEAAAFLMRCNGGEINLMALLKLLYLADRRSLIERGQPITGDRMVSMPHGPVLSQIYDCINWGKAGGEDRPWSKCISDRTGYDVRLISEPTFEELSEYEMELLTEIHARFGSMTQFQLRDLTHTLPEWHDPDGSSLAIDPIEILKSAGLSDEAVREVVLDAEELYFLRQSPSMIGG
jgi:uncharacterized phage-associated protein